MYSNIIMTIYGHIRKFGQPEALCVRVGHDLAETRRVWGSPRMWFFNRNAPTRASPASAKPRWGSPSHAGKIKHPIYPPLFMYYDTHTHSYTCTCTHTKTVELLRTLKRAFWPFAWECSPATSKLETNDREGGSSSHGGFRWGVGVSVLCVCVCMCVWGGGGYAMHVRSGYKPFTMALRSTIGREAMSYYWFWRMSM